MRWSERHRRETEDAPLLLDDGRTLLAGGAPPLCCCCWPGTYFSMSIPVVCERGGLSVSNRPR
jgi:hypothetical protein